jgi:asparagine synthase (glutamine-hydrolysing)
MAEDLLLSERALGRSYFQPETIRGMWTRHQEGQQNHAHHLWALMVLELWHRMFVDESAPAEAALRMPGAGR